MEKARTVGSERIAALFDAGTFVETGAFVKRAGGELTGVVCGYGAIDGKLAYAFVQDSDRQKGAFDAIQAEKIAALYAMALKNRAPVIGVFDSIGAVVCDGASALSGYGKLLKVVSDASGVIPQIALISGVCAGMSATVAAMFDFVVTIKGTSELFVSSPFVAGKEIGTPEYTAKVGLSSVVAENEADAQKKIADLVSLLPSNNEEGVYAEELTDDVNRLLPAGLCGKALVEAISDAGVFFEIAPEYAPETLTGLSRIGGVTVGIVASNPAQKGGVITVEGAQKAAKLVRLCDAYSIPVVTLIDSVGVETGKASEEAPLSNQLGKLAMSYATADTAKITAVVGKAYGAAFTLLGSKALGADVVFATSAAEISTMAPASAVAFLWNDRINEDTTREALEAEWKETYTTPEVVAMDGSIDDVIADSEIRQRICSAVYMLLAKNANAPARKHCNLPL